MRGEASLGFAEPPEETTTPSEGCFGDDGHDRAEVLAVERTVSEGAVLEESNAQHLHCAAIAEAHVDCAQRTKPSASAATRPAPEMKASVALGLAAGSLASSVWSHFGRSRQAHENPSDGGHVLSLEKGATLWAAPKQKPRENRGLGLNMERE